MFINEVEHKVGLSKKSIRYYEEHGLLKPSRNQENDYRIYNESDIKKLQTIKFLRELGVSIKELEQLETKETSLFDCIQDRIKKINAEEEKYKTTKNMCEEILKKGETFQNIDITKYFVTMNVLNKEGFTMRNLKTNKKKKIVGAIVSSLIFSVIIIFVPVIISYFQFTETDKIPWLIYWILIALFALPLSGIIYNLIIRIKEINGGEEDEASKY